MERRVVIREGTNEAAQRIVLTFEELKPPPERSLDHLDLIPNWKQVGSWTVSHLGSFEANKMESWIKQGII